jgi:hypothetical protein
MTEIRIASASRARAGKARQSRPGRRPAPTLSSNATTACSRTAWARAGDIVVRSRSPVFALCRALLAAGANPNSKLESFRGSVLALTVKTIGIGAKLTIRETVTDGPRVVRWKPLQDRDVSAPVRQNDDPALSPFLKTRWLQGRCASIPRSPDPQKRSAAATRKPRAGAGVSAQVLGLVFVFGFAIQFPLFTSQCCRPGGRGLSLKWQGRCAASATLRSRSGALCATAT